MVASFADSLPQRQSYKKLARYSIVPILSVPMPKQLEHLYIGFQPRRRDGEWRSPALCSWHQKGGRQLGELEQTMAGIT
jgi:hypothetical protein